MRAVDIIQKKRDGKSLSSEEISFLLKEYQELRIPDYQMSSFLMATYFKGLDPEELKVFTDCMINSGEQIKFEDIDSPLLDKHSTGGVGDKTSIAFAPLMASFGISTAKLSGKGLGHTGGTIDKFESIAGFEFPSAKDQMVAIVNQTGIGIMGYSDSIVPLDKKLYSLRDVTATVDSIPLIASSIMSKKLAVQSDAIILDVKVGSGAFMKNKQDAKLLAQTMIDIAHKFGKKIKVLLTNMNQPLGYAVGNSLEVIEAIETLKGNGPKDFESLLFNLAASALITLNKAETNEQALEMIHEKIKSGLPLKHLGSFIRACGGDESVIDNYKKLPTARKQMLVESTNGGYIKSIDAEKIGKAAMILGAGRATKDDRIDHAVGLLLNKKVGDQVTKGETIAEIMFNNDSKASEAAYMINQSLEFSEKKVAPEEVIIEII